MELSMLYSTHCFADSSGQFLQHRRQQSANETNFYSILGFIIDKVGKDTYSYAQ